MLEVYDAARLAETQPNEVGDALERGNIVKFTPCPIELPSSDELQTLRETLPQQLQAKNVSYHPEADRVTGLEESSPINELAYRVSKNTPRAGLGAARVRHARACEKSARGNL